MGISAPAQPRQSTPVQPVVPATPAPTQTVSQSSTQVASPQSAPVQTQTQSGEQKKQSAADLLKRMAENPTERDAQPTSSIKPEEIGYNSQDIEKIKDPMARQVVQDIYKNMEKGLNKKFMEVADQKKQFESDRQRFEQERLQSQIWTQEKLDATLRDPSFIQLAQARIQAQQAAQAPQHWQGSQDEWSALTQSEKQQFMGLQQAVSNQQMQLNQMLTQQYHERLKTKYPDYEPQKVERTLTDAREGRIPDSDVMEMVWKATQFDRAVERAYQYGLQDRNGNLAEKMNGSSFAPNGVSAGVSDDIPVEIQQMQKTNPRGFFKAIAEFRLRKAQSSGNTMSRI